MKKPPRKVLTKLRELGYHNIQWTANTDDEWFAGYCAFNEDNINVLITVAIVTGKALIEVLKRHKLIEVET